MDALFIPFVELMFVLRDSAKTGPDSQFSLWFLAWMLCGSWTESLLYTHGSYLLVGKAFSFH